MKRQLKTIRLYTVRKEWKSGQVLYPRIGWPTEWFNPMFNYTVRTWKTLKGAEQFANQHATYDGQAKLTPVIWTAKEIYGAPVICATRIMAWHSSS